MYMYTHAYNSPFSLPGSHPGSVATTPAPITSDTSGFLRPGSQAVLPATVCQESEGIYIYMYMQCRSL